METLIHEQQEGYYEALNASNSKGESTIFVTSVLQIIRDTLAEIIANQDSHRDVRPNVGVNAGTNNLCIAICKAMDKTLDELFWDG